MNKSQIITLLYTGKNFNDCISRMEPAHLRDDLKQEVIAIVCEWPEEKLVELHEQRVLDFYVARVIINQIQSSTSPFYKKYRGYVLDIDENRWESLDDAVFKRSDSSDCNRLNSHAAKDYAKKIDHLRDTEAREMEERWVREQLEQFAIEQINTLHWYNKEMLLLYLKLGSFRAIEKATRIPFVSCYKNVQQSIKLLREKVSSGECKPVFTRQELHSIQNGNNQ